MNTIYLIQTSSPQFLYESETKAEETDHHQLLKDIQHGVKLRKVTTNDKSKPYIEGIINYIITYDSVRFEVQIKMH